jgi:hypothetical protein
MKSAGTFGESVGDESDGVYSMRFRYIALCAQLIYFSSLPSINAV